MGMNKTDGRQIKPRRNYAAWLYCVLAGFTLMNLSLFLHPMSPADFLELAISDPLVTVLEPNGNGIAAIFWFSVALMFAGVLGSLARSRYVRRIISTHKHTHHPLAH